MNTAELSFATLTWARNREEEDLLRTSLKNLAALGAPVFITDGGSGPEFLDFLRSFSNFELVSTGTRGVWAQAKSSVLKAYASGSPYIFYTEPDKRDFFSRGLPKMLDQLSVHEQTGVVMASRSATAFQSFPAFQQMTETSINNCCAELIGPQVDYTYGPFLLNRNLVPQLVKMPEDTGWGWRPFAFGIAHRLNYRVDAYEADFYCPTEQRGDDAGERSYRMKQLMQNIQGLLLSASVTLGEKP